jgi:hypothetical protein
MRMHTGPKKELDDFTFVGGGIRLKGRHLFLLTGFTRPYSCR